LQEYTSDSVILVGLWMVLCHSLLALCGQSLLSVFHGAFWCLSSKQINLLIVAMMSKTWP